MVIISINGLNMLFLLYYAPSFPIIYLLDKLELPPPETSLLINSEIKEKKHALPKTYFLLHLNVIV